MKAAQINHYKQATLTLTDTPVPVVGAHDVLVKIIAASINPLDLKLWPVVSDPCSNITCR